MPKTLTTDPHTQGTLLTQADLDDPERFVTLPGVPLLDVHKHADKGDVTMGMLQAHVRNMARDCKNGQFPPLALGHIMPKQTHEIERNGVVYRVKGTPESGQPKITGYASRPRIGYYQGRPTAFGDIHIHRGHYDETSEYPWVSVERIEPDEDDDPNDMSGHVIDRIALLKTPPERPLGVIRYSSEDGTNRFRRICYAGDFRPLELSPLIIEEDEPMPTIARDNAESPVSPQQAIANPPLTRNERKDKLMAMEPEVQPGDDTPLTMGMFRQHLLPEIVSAIHAKMMEPMEGADVPPATHTEEDEREVYADDDDDEMVNQGNEQPTDAEDEEDDRVPYGASEPGSDNVFTPGMVKEKEKKEMDDVRVAYSRMDREFKAFVKKTEKAQKDAEDTIGFLYGRLQEGDLDKRKLVYGREVQRLVDLGHDIDVEEEVAELVQGAPKEWEERRIKDLSKRQRRADYGRPNRLDHTPGNNGAGGGARELDKGNWMKVVQHAERRGISLPEARAELKL